MSGMTSLPPIAGLAARPPLARVEKASESSSLHNDAPTDEERRESASRQTRRPSESHSGTGAASRWNGPRWSAPFVAQILGQVISRNAPDTVAAHAAYANTGRMRVGVGFDRQA